MFESDISLGRSSCTTEGPVWPLMAHSLTLCTLAWQRKPPKLILSLKALSAKIQKVCFDVGFVGAPSARVTCVLRKLHLKMCPSTLLHRQTVSYCECDKSPAGRGVTGRTSRTLKVCGQFSCVFFLFFAHQQGTSMSEVSQRLRSAACVAALSARSK